jgi:hypothetical protein
MYYTKHPANKNILHQHDLHQFETPPRATPPRPETLHEQSAALALLGLALKLKDGY